MSLKPKRKRKPQKTTARRRGKTAQTKIDIETHFGRISQQSSIIKSAETHGPVNAVFWVDVISPKRGAWTWHKISDVKKEMREYVPKARYDGYFDGAKDNPNRKVYFKVPIGAKLEGIHYSDWELGD